MTGRTSEAFGAPNERARHAAAPMDRLVPVGDGCTVGDVHDSPRTRTAAGHQGDRCAELIDRGVAGRGNSGIPGNWNCGVPSLGRECYGKGRQKTTGNPDRMGDLLGVLTAQNVGNRSDKE